jgi:orf1 protein
MIKIKCLYVNHIDETFAELTHGQALDYIFSAESIDMFSDFSGVVIDLPAYQIELFKNTGLVGFEEYNQRVDELSKVYKNITDEISEVG